MADKVDIKEAAINAAMAIRVKYPRAKKVSISATENDDPISGKRTVNVTAKIDGKDVDLDG
jgi:hypothetical protein